MKIISKYKDYYDYLQGIYGVDEKLVLDRTKFTKTVTFDSTYQQYKIIKFYICDWLIEGVIYNNKLLFGKDIKQIAYNYNDNPEYNRWNYKKDTDEYYQIYNSMNLNKYSYSIEKVLKEPQKLSENKSINIKVNCPIIIEILKKDYGMFPILKDYNLVDVFSPQDIWIMLSEWIAKSNDKQIVDNRTDVQKLEGKGFDSKTSFRKM